MALLIIPERNEIVWFLIGDQELEVRKATCGPEIDQLQYAQSVSHIIIVSIGCAIVIFHSHNLVRSINTLY